MKLLPIVRRAEGVRLPVSSGRFVGLEFLICAGVAFRLVLYPCALDVPSAETLMKRVIPSEMAVLNKAMTLVPTRNEVNFLIVAHSVSSGW